MRRSDKILSCVKFLNQRIKGHPKLALILGSGLAPHINYVRGEGNILDKDFVTRLSVPYSSIPHFPIPGVPGHKGKLLICRLRDIPLLILSGRVHYYEGYGIEDVAFPIRVLASLGIEQLIITNAAGAINPKFQVGDLMLITDQINFQFCRLNEHNEPNALYNRGLIKLAEKAAGKERLRIRKGVYVGVTGPNFETPAEIRMFHKFGADAVGMSTVAEVSMAAHLGMDVLGISCMVNKAAGLSLPRRQAGKRALGHMDVLRTMQRIKKPLSRLIKSIVLNIR